MSVREDWVYTEERLEQLTGSMAQLLVAIRPHISTRMIEGEGWEKLLDRTSEVPATLGAFPFGFEIPLQDARPIADFGVSLIGGSRTAAGYQKRNHLAETDQSAAMLAELLDETDREDSLLRRVVGRKMLLEYDIDLENDQRPAPGVFLYPANDVLGAGSERFRELGVVHDALTQAGGWDPDPAERQELEQLYRALQPDTLIRACGTFPSRQRATRIAVTGFRTAASMKTFLGRAGWPGSADAVDAIVSFFEVQKAFAYLGTHFDITRDGIGPRLGLSFFAQEREWLKDIRYWNALIDGIGEQGYALQEKLEELARWATGSAVLMSKSGPIMLVRGIHHIKLAITGDQVEQAKAYVFFLPIHNASLKIGHIGRPSSSPSSPHRSCQYPLPS